MVATGKPNGIIVSGMLSSSGKTAVTCLLAAALRKRDVPIQPFKIGPDFIDPAYHAAACGEISRNLDKWMMGEAGIQKELAHGEGKLAIVEGVMGLFDGGLPNSDDGSAMDLARSSGFPILLVAPAQKTGRSLAAALRGFQLEAAPHGIAGVILNQVNGTSHTEFLREAIRPLGLPVLGAIPPLPELRWGERHLGLQAVQETPASINPEILAGLAEEHLNVDEILTFLSIRPAETKPLPRRANTKRIAVARDEAFHFYYPANLEYLESAGAELVPFSPLADSCLPDAIDGIYLGGGFPEQFAARIADNKTMRASVREAARDLPVLAECGGFMFLAETLETKDGKTYPMAGAVGGVIQMTDRLQNFGYCSGIREGEPMARGHEFHYSRWLQEAESANLWSVVKRRSGALRPEGVLHARVRASYIHTYFPAASHIPNTLFEL